MGELIRIWVSFPTIVYTMLLAVALVYWALMLVGVFELEGADADIEVGADADVDVDVEADVDADADADVDVQGSPGGGPFVVALGLLRLRRVPLAISFSFLALFGWLLSYFGERYARAFLDALLPHLVASVALGLGTFLMAWPLVLLATLPLEPLFATREAPKSRDLLGKVVQIQTGKVTQSFGQAILEDGGAGLLVRVRCDEARGLIRGSQALLVDYDEEADVFDVEPMDGLLGKEKTE